MSAIESILEAYCVELDEVINIEEAHDAFLARMNREKGLIFCAVMNSAGSSISLQK